MIFWIILPSLTCKPSYRRMGLLKKKEASDGIRLGRLQNSYLAATCNWNNVIVFYD